jgi:uncharacterized protein YjbI with pentapeptide repeats
MSTPALIVLLAALAAGAFVAVAYRRRWGWTGFGERTLWDWFGLLVIPLVLAGAAFALNVAATNRDDRRDDARAARDRAVVVDRRREDALDAYVRQMSDLILARRRSAGGSWSREEETVGRALTLTVVRRLDGRRKGFVLQFLGDAGLLDYHGNIIGLGNADLRHAQLRGTLEDANLAVADLRGADFRGAVLYDVNFAGAYVSGADFRDARLTRVAFDDSDLLGARFDRVAIDRATFDNTCLERASFRSARLGSVRFGVVEGRDVDFSGVRRSSTRLPRVGRPCSPLVVPPGANG